MKFRLQITTAILGAFAIRPPLTIGQAVGRAKAAMGQASNFGQTPQRTTAGESDRHLAESERDLNKNLALTETDKSAEDPRRILPAGPGHLKSSVMRPAL